VQPQIQHVKTSDGASIGFFSMGDGPPIVFGSNAWGDAHFYQSLHPHTRRMTDGLVELGWRVVRYDLRGMGSSGRVVTEMSQQALLRDLEAVVDKLGLQKFALGGLNAGAATALHYAAEHPDRVTQLVLLNPFRLGANRFGQDPVGRSLSSLSALAEDDWAFFNLVVGNLVTNFANPDHARDLATIFQRSTSPKTHLAYLKVLQTIDLTSVLPLVEAPALIVHDTGFPFGSFADCEDLAAPMPHARIQVIPGDGEAELAAIDSFLRSASTAGKVATPAFDGSGKGHLTPRETEVLRLVASGKTNREISDGLVLSERTVSRHITNIYAKLGLHSKAEATAYAIHGGLA
jgi:pimeloyl-ACP methyl ester carboxylesterase/DNA-binding CsgD family transcriptional regulator